MMANAQKKSHAAGDVAAQGEGEAEPAGEAEEGEVDAADRFHGDAGVQWDGAR